MKLRTLKIVILIIIAIFVLYLIIWTFDFSKGEEPRLGITFSQFYTQEQLGLDWQKTYLAILEDLNPEYLRLIAYWQYLEPIRGQFNFEDLDWQITEAEKRNKEIILVAGHRVPRWPECHHPAWAEKLATGELQEAILEFLSQTINHYKDIESIKAWQIENEPLFFLFGNCPKPDREFLKKEIALVKSLDPTRPIIITDSGELSLWLKTSGLSEILGTTLYRTVWGKPFGYFKHLYPPVFYTLRGWVAKKFFGNQKIIISELQGEPWGREHKSLAQVPLEEQLKHFSLKDLKKNLQFAKKTGVSEIYLWGVEWHYWLKEIHNDPTFWKEAKEIFNK
ncbi:beta-galactosidase [Patescibacteria group bacterium]|nr:beta-galactosidase [Patescibacteria group bacterium]